MVRPRRRRSPWPRRRPPRPNTGAAFPDRSRSRRRAAGGDVGHDHVAAGLQPFPHTCSSAVVDASMTSGCDAARAIGTGSSAQSRWTGPIAGWRGVVSGCRCRHVHIETPRQEQVIGRTPLSALAPTMQPVRSTAQLRWSDAADALLQLAPGCRRAYSSGSLVSCLRYRRPRLRATAGTISRPLTDRQGTASFVSP